MGGVTRGKHGKPGPSLFDQEADESSLPMITSSAIELVEEQPKKNVPVIEEPMIEDPAEASFFEIEQDSKSLSSLSSSSLSDPLVLAGVAPRRRSRVLPWLLFILSVTATGAAWVEIVKPRFDMLDAAEAKLGDAARELSASQAQVHSLDEKVTQLEGEKAALTTERDGLAQVQAVEDEKLKAREELAERLRIAFAEEKRVEVAVLDDAVALRMTTDDVFVFGDVTLKDTALVDQIGGVVKGQGDHRLTIAAHTDSTPVPSKLRARFPSNYELAAARAFAVFHQLEPQKLGDRIDIVAAGATQPIASNKSQQGRRKNRRIEILIR